MSDTQINTQEIRSRVNRIRSDIFELISIGERSPFDHGRANQLREKLMQDLLAVEQASNAIYQNITNLMGQLQDIGCILNNLLKHASEISPLK
ncbi:MAG: hypothetical protein NTY03_00915 [Candidatus Bathyarchaeota archaeon]|nr:hypothetical protein [Candidatus Bathyarchaeota archaeon]